MRVTLSPFIPRNESHTCPGWLFIRIETETRCTEIHTSNIFPPYHELYIWLGKVRDHQLPAQMIIDEEGRGVELIAEELDAQHVYFHIEPWMCGLEDVGSRLQAKIEPHHLIAAFHQGIIEFFRNNYDPIAWPDEAEVSNLNWDALLRPSQTTSSPKWDQRLSWLGGGRGRRKETGRQHLEPRLNLEQKRLLNLYDGLGSIGLQFARGNYQTVQALIHLHQEFSLNWALDELDDEWHQQRKESLNQELGILSHCSSKRRRHQAQARLKTLKVGQLVDGQVSRIKPYGVFVEIGGLSVLLSARTISQEEVENLENIFQIGDWIRGLVIWMDQKRRRVLLSTADLEVESGDMLDDPLKVYATAEEMAERYRLNVVDRLEKTTSSKDSD